MACTYRFTGTDGKQIVIKGQAAFKAFLADGGLEQLGVAAPEAPAFQRRQAGGELMGINVNQDGDNAYADKIIDGEKTIETRASDSLRPYVGKRVAIVRTGAGPAKAIGEVTIGEPIIVNTQKEFDKYRDKTLVPKGSTFDIAPGGVKYLYPVSNPVRYEQEREVGSGIVARKVIEPKFSGRQELRDAADAIAKMDPDVRDNTMIGDFPGAADGYMLYEARVLLKKPSEKLKRVNENNSFELWNRYDYIANVDGELFGVTKQEDPDEPDDESKFVYSFAPLDDPFKDVTTTTDQTDELFKEMRASLGAAPAFSKRNIFAQPAPLANWTAPLETKGDNVIYALQNKQIDTKRVIEAITQAGNQ
ncbi:MAG: ASCH domain-containing protein, partial [Cyanobacteriota bacterium]